MATQRLRSEALPGTGGGLELIDWLEIRHDESDAIVEATRSALHYLRTLKQSIPTGPAPVVTNAAEEAEEIEDTDALEGSQGITKRELLERQVDLPPNPTRCAALATHGHHRPWQYYSRQERENVLEDEDEEDEEDEEGAQAEGAKTEKARGSRGGRGRGRSDGRDKRGDKQRAQAENIFQ